jgi:hypothetical protein
MPARLGCCIKKANEVGLPLQFGPKFEKEQEDKF